MKRIFKFLAGLTIVLVCVSFISVGILVAGLLMGIQTGIWVHWYLALFSTFAALLAASAASIVFITEFAFHGFRHVSSTVKEHAQVSYKQGKQAYSA